MTKEEIVRDEYEKMFGMQKYDNSVNRKMNFQYFSPAMDQYAKQESMAFVEWANYNFIWEDNDKWTHADTTETYTTEKLYDIFFSK